MDNISELEYTYIMELRSNVIDLTTLEVTLNDDEGTDIGLGNTRLNRVFDILNKQTQDTYYVSNVRYNDQSNEYIITCIAENSKYLKYLLDIAHLKSCINKIEECNPEFTMKKRKR